MIVLIFSIAYSPTLLAFVVNVILSSLAAAPPRWNTGVRL
jgi:hypothetical protein